MKANPFTVYGLRLQGDKEVRYVGFTRFTPEERLTRHFINGNYHQAFFDWLHANREQLEAFAIIGCRDMAEARAMEKSAITTCVYLGQRLFNRGHVPADLRWAA